MALTRAALTLVLLAGCNFDFNTGVTAPHVPELCKPKAVECDDAGVDLWVET